MPAPTRLAVTRLEDRATPAVTPADPLFASQWAHAAISSPAAWGVTTGTGNTIVAVLDTGVDVAHPDLAANLWVNPREVAGNGRDDDGNGFVDDVHGVDFTANSGTPTDASGHGTHVAGVVAAAGNNGVGVAGVAWTARVMALKVMAPAGGLTSDAVRAVDYAVANGARVVNMSFGGPLSDPALLAAVRRARGAGVIVVAAAGNGGADLAAVPFYPAAYSLTTDNVVTVAAADRAGRLTAYSNSGAAAALAAPGESVLSTTPGGGYGLKSGTSIATPHVAGAAALVWDRHPDWSYTQVIAAIKAGVDAAPALAGRVATGGRLNVAKAVGAPPAAPPPVAPPPAPAPAPTGARVTDAVLFGVRATQFDRAIVSFSGPVDPAAVAAGVTVTGPAGRVRVSAVVPAVGNARFTLLFSRPQTAGGVYTVAVTGAAAPHSVTRVLGAAPVSIAPDGVKPATVADRQYNTPTALAARPITTANWTIEVVRPAVGAAAARAVLFPVRHAAPATPEAGFARPDAVGDAAAL